MTSKLNSESDEYKMHFRGSYPQEAETVHEAFLYWEYDEDAGHPETTLRGFWKRENERC
jgi:hypothetical protein